MKIIIKNKTYGPYLKQGRYSTLLPWYDEILLKNISCIDDRVKPQVLHTIYHVDSYRGRRQSLLPLNPETIDSIHQIMHIFIINNL